MASRADTLTTSLKQQELFSDFLNSFAKTPYDNQLGRVTNEESINQSIKNIVLTHTGERLFQPLVGSEVSTQLFELADNFQASKVEYLVKLAIQNNEPRANVLAVTVLDETDSNAFGINIVYAPINSNKPVNLNFILRRVR